MPQQFIDLKRDEPGSRDDVKYSVQRFRSSRPRPSVVNKPAKSKVPTLVLSTVLVVLLGIVGVFWHNQYCESFGQPRRPLKR